MKVVRVLSALLLVAAARVVLAQSCELPVPFNYEYQNNIAASLGGTGLCALTASTTSSSRTTAAAFLHYQRLSPLTSVRYGFRIDTSALATGSANEQVTLLSATSPVIVGADSDNRVASLLEIYFRQGSQNSLMFAAADVALASHLHSSAAPLTTSLNTVRVEINVGPAGNVRYWINHAFTDSPDGVIETALGSGLDNSAWLGVIGAEIGMSNPTSSFRAAHAGQSIVFDNIESSDDVLFSDDFTSGAQ